MADSLLNDRYQLVRMLGEGSSAQTWLGEDTHEGGRQVAIKLLRVERLEDWKYLELFEREADVLSSLQHACIPALYDFFEVEQQGAPRLVIVQEHIEGASLAERTLQGPRLGTMEVTQLALGVLDVLDYLHTRSPPVYHRDIKPSNIIVRPMGSPVLIDFGSVCSGWRPADEGGSTIVGTHGFMPPEQYMGQVSATSDLYALGASLLYVITGQHPRDFPFDSGRIEIPDDLPAAPAMRALLNRLLEPAPRDRPASAAEARTLLLSEGREPIPSSRALVRTGSRSLAPLAVGDSKRTPKFVDMGAPGRDPNGEHAAVYANMVPSSVLRTQRIDGNKPSAPLTKGIYAWHIILNLCTFGVLYLLVYSSHRAVRKRAHPLFTDGIYTEGHIVRIERGGALYEFEADGQRHRGSCGFPGLEYLQQGDTVSVLYKPDDPNVSTIAYE